MTMLVQRIQQQFFESADLKYQSAELLSRPIQDAVAALVGGLTAGGRVLVAVPHERRARVLETQLLVLHCLCDAIDQQLLGEQDPA